MSFFDKLRQRFKRKTEISEPILIGPEVIEHLPSADDSKFYRDSKKLLQRFDEYITAAEAENETLCLELDDIIEQQEAIRIQIKSLDKEGSWHERSLLLRLDRLTHYGDNLKRRIEIYSQNIKLYLNLISKIQDIKAMRMNGLSEDRIETIWLEFKEAMEQYKQKLMSEEASFEKETVTTKQLEDRLTALKNKIRSPVDEDSTTKIEKHVEEKRDLQRIALDDFITNGIESGIEDTESGIEDNEVILE